MLEVKGLSVSRACKDMDFGESAVRRWLSQVDAEQQGQSGIGNHSAAMGDIADYMVGFYNCERLHSKLGNLSPNAFERESANQQVIAVSEIT